MFASPRNSINVHKERSSQGSSFAEGEDMMERPPDAIDAMLDGAAIIGGGRSSVLRSSIQSGQSKSSAMDIMMDGSEVFDTIEEKQASCVNKIVVAVILLAFIGFVIADSLTNKWIGTGLQAFLEWIQDNPGPGVLSFILVYFAATVLFVPGTILTLGAGFVFGDAFGLGLGILLGTLSVFVGASAGAIVSFLLGRFLLRSWVTGLTRRYTIFEALDKAFEDKGFRIMALLRLSPIIPFNAINYIAGVTAISFWAYFWALIAILPGTTLYVFLGASAGSLTDSASSGDNFTLTIIIACVGIVFGFLAVAVASYYAKKELRKIAEKREQEEGGGGASSTRQEERASLTLSVGV